MKNRYVHIYKNCMGELYIEDEFHEPAVCSVCGDFESYVGEFNFGYPDEIIEFLNLDFSKEYLASFLVQNGVQRSLLLKCINNIVETKKREISELESLKKI